MKTQIRVSNDLLEYQNDHKDLVIAFHDLELTHKALVEEVTRKSNELDEINRVHNDTLADVENQERENKTQQSVINHIEIQKDELFEKHRIEARKIYLKMSAHLNEYGMMIEDYRIQIVKRDNTIEKKTVEIEFLDQSSSDQKGVISRLLEIEILYHKVLDECKDLKATIAKRDSQIVYKEEEIERMNEVKTVDTIKISNLDTQIVQ